MANERQGTERGTAAERGICCAGALAAVVVLAILAAPMLSGRVYTYNDLGNYHLPLRLFYARCLATGENFTWIPNLFCGFYLHGEGQVGMYHPLHFVLYYALPLDTAFNLELLSSYPFMLAGMFLFLRRWEMRRDAALLGALVFAFSGFNLLHYIHIQVIAIVAHIPWLLLTLDGVLRQSNRRKASTHLLGFILLTGSQLLLGAPQFVFFSVLVELLYALLIFRRWASGWRIAVVGMGMVLGVLVGCVQLVPTLDALRHSERHDTSAEFRYTNSLHPANLAQLLSPYLFNQRFYPQETSTSIEGSTHEFGLYNGAVTVALILFLLTRWKHLGERRLLLRGVLILSGVAIVLALGRYGLLYSIQLQIPLAGVFRCPSRYIVLVHLAMAVGAALSFEHIAGMVRRRERAGLADLWPLSIGVAGSVLLTIGALFLATERGSRLSAALYVASPAHALLGTVLALFAAGLVATAARGSRYALLGIVLFAVADQGSYGLSFIREKPPTAGGTHRGEGWMTLRTFGDLLDPPRGVDCPRIETWQNAFLVKGYRLCGGYAGLPPARQLDYTRPASLRVAGVGWKRERRRFRKGKRMFVEFTPWERVPEPLPRARLVARTIVSANPREDIEKIDIRTAALVSENLSVEGGSPGQAMIRHEHPGEITIETVADSRQLLVVSESYHEGWRASVDGQSGRVHRVYGDFMGCVVGPGKHEVRFRFRPSSLVIGKQLSLAGLVLAVILFAGVRLRPAW